MRRNMMIAILGILAIVAMALAFALYPRGQPLTLVEYSVLRSSTNFFCLGDTLIYAPNGLEVFGVPPKALHECTPSLNPIGGSEAGANFLLRPLQGWNWSPQMSDGK